MTPVGAADEPAPDPQVVVTTPERGPASTYRIVGRTDPAVPGNLSVAVDLMTLDRPTVERPEPRLAVVGRAQGRGRSALAALVLLGGALGALRWRRRAG